MPLDAVVAFTSSRASGTFETPRWSSTPPGAGSPYSRVQGKAVDSVEAVFNRLADRWQQETGLLSSQRERHRHPAYKDILALRRAVVPYLVQALDERPDLWFAALESLTGIDAVKDDDAYGDYVAMAEAWRRWWRSDESKQFHFKSAAE